MKILMVNKFLYPKGGSETYIFKLGKMLEKMGHTVEYFGMEHDGNIVGNSQKLYTQNKEFKGNSSLSRLVYPFSIIYSFDARKKIAVLLDSFKPDVVHLNNINFQITPSIIYEIKKRGIKTVWTAHDYKILCPNHSFYLYDKNEVCERCINGNFSGCFKNKCLHGSSAKSLIAMIEGFVYYKAKAYSYVDKIICPSEFMAKKLKMRADIKPKCVAMHNFIDKMPQKQVDKGDYVLYFGRFDAEKGIETLLEVCKRLKSVNFVFAGSGELEDKLAGFSNVKNVGFKSGNELEMLIRRAKFTVYPSQWYENCPFSIMESQSYGVPVVGANIGGIPELVDDKINGRLFESGSADDLERVISELYKNEDELAKYAENCLKKDYDTTESYCEKLIELYK